MSAKYKFIRVNYEVNRKICPGGIGYLNASMRIKGRWLDTPTHDKIVSIIRRRHPDWLISGYALAPKNK